MRCQLCGTSERDLSTHCSQCLDRLINSYLEIMRDDLESIIRLCDDTHNHTHAYMNALAEQIREHAERSMLWLDGNRTNTEQNPLRVERDRCVRVVQEARESGNADLREIIARIRNPD